MTADSHTEFLIRENVREVLNSNWDNVTVPLSQWQILQLGKSDTEAGISCLLRMWFLVQRKLIPGTYCNATWDGHYCWPPAESNTTVSRLCSEAFRESQPIYAPHLDGSAYRVCQANATWLWGNWTNYSNCADSYEAYVEKAAAGEEEQQLVKQVQYILYVGSILSLLCLLSAISIFCCFKSLWCDRVSIQIHLMAALILRYILLYIITEAFVWDRATNYRDVDWLCKMVLIVYLYATVASVNWMFIQGVYLNTILTSNRFDKKAPFKLYFAFGWIAPILLLTLYAVVMETNHPVKCWKGYSDMNELWIILVPIITALMINLLLMINILRILITKTQGNGTFSDAAKCFRRAAKATLILSPILGVTNLLFVYNPGGIYNKYYVILNSLFGSTQGVFVAFTYCYLSSEVHSAIRRFLFRRSAGRRMQQRRASSSITSSGVIIEHPLNCFSNTNSCQGNAGTRIFTLQIPTTTNSLIQNSVQIKRGENSVRLIYSISGFAGTRLMRNETFSARRNQGALISRGQEDYGMEPRVIRQTNLPLNDAIIPLSELLQVDG